MYFGMLDAMEAVRVSAGRIQLPIVMQLAGDERIVSRPDSEALYARLGSPQKELRIYEKSYHEIYNDFERESAFADLHQFLQAQLHDQRHAQSVASESSRAKTDNGKGSNT
jgi:alpha-beta hydrolase superfamily lysophospholipase